MPRRALPGPGERPQGGNADPNRRAARRRVDQVWAKTFDRELSVVVAVQDEISEAIASSRSPR